MKIAFCASEVFPFAKTGGLADVCGALPLALKKEGLDVRVFLPAYRGIVDAFEAQKISEGLFQTRLPGDIPVYLIAHEGYFDRDSFYGDERGDYADNFERFLFFNQHIFERCQEVEFIPDIIHCHDWQTALLPVLLKYKYRQFENWAATKSILTIHNIAFQGFFPKEQILKIGLPESYPQEDAIIYDRLNFLKAGMIAADGVNTVSPQYVVEIQTPEFGCGLDHVVRSLSSPVKGILNGIDYDSWNPPTDPFIEAPIFADNFQIAKAVNKEVLQLALDLPVEPRVPLFGFVGRLSHQKGIEILLEALPQLLSLSAQFVILGMGEAKYETALRKAAAGQRDQLVFISNYCEYRAHHIYAGSDFFLMPSVFEPCGLTQMISMAYGTLPVVHLVGGLRDTVYGYDKRGLEANGFGFEVLTARNFIQALESAIAVYQVPAEMDQLRCNALKTDFSWTSAAHAYQKFYQCLLSD